MAETCGVYGGRRGTCRILWGNVKERDLDYVGG